MVFFPKNLMKKRHLELIISLNETSKKNFLEK